MNKKNVIIAAVAVVAIVVIAGVIILFSQNEESQAHNVTYDACGGTVRGESIYTTNIVTFCEHSAERNGYSFLGWYDNKEYTGSPMKDGDKLTKDITVYAKWTTYLTLNVESSNMNKFVSSFSINDKEGKANDLYVGLTAVLPTDDDSTLHGTAKIYAREGSQFQIKHDSGDYFVFCGPVGDKNEYQFAQFTLTGATDVTYGIDNDKGYVQFSYTSNIKLKITEITIGICYRSNDCGEFPTEYDHVTDYTMKFVGPSETFTPNAGLKLDGWNSKSDGTGHTYVLNEELSLKDVDEKYHLIFVYAQCSSTA